MEAAAGFEPAKYAGFANRCLEPLGYAAIEVVSPAPGTGHRRVGNTAILAAGGAEGQAFSTP